MNTDFSTSIVAVKRFLWRYHIVLFIVIAAAGTGLAIYSLLDVTAKSNGTLSTAEPAQTGFDQATITRVKQLNDTPNYNFALPTNQRNNPFTE